ncbi:hypothetical protein Vafri_4534, partial [Volvox africanus]
SMQPSPPKLSGDSCTTRWWTSVEISSTRDGGTAIGAAVRGLDLSRNTTTAHSRVHRYEVRPHCSNSCFKMTHHHLSADDVVAAATAASSRCIMPCEVFLQAFDGVCDEG